MTPGLPPSWAQAPGTAASATETNTVLAGNAKVTTTLFAVSASEFRAVIV
jgi:hypothetical protein